MAPNSSDLKSTGLSSFGAKLKSHYEPKPKPERVPKFKDAIQLIWSALEEKPLTMLLKDFHKRLQVHVSANSGHTEHIRDTNSSSSSSSTNFIATQVLKKTSGPLCVTCCTSVNATVAGGVRCCMICSYI